MAQSKFLDYDGLTKFKSKLDETYMKNNFNMDLGDFSGTLEQILQSIISNINNNSNIISTHTSNTAIHVPTTIGDVSYSNYILTRDKDNTTPSWSPGVVVPFESGTDKIFMNLTTNTPTWENISTLVSKLPLASGYGKLENKTVEFTDPQIGLVSTSTQSFCGEKQFNNGIRLVCYNEDCTNSADEEFGLGVSIYSPNIYFGKNTDCTIYRGCFNNCFDNGLTIYNTNEVDGSINFITRDNIKWDILGSAPNGIPVFHNNLHINPDYQSTPTSKTSGICIYENKYYNENGPVCNDVRSQGFIGYNERTNIDDNTAFAPFVMETDVSDIELITPGKINLKTPGGLLINDEAINIGPASGWHLSDISTNEFEYQEMSPGILTTEKQSIAGEKQFNDGIRLVPFEVYCDTTSADNNIYYYGGLNANETSNLLPLNHTKRPSINFGYTDNTKIFGDTIRCTTFENLNYNDSILCIKSPGFNVLYNNFYLPDNMSISNEKTEFNYSNFYVYGLQHYNSGIGYYLYLGKLTTTYGESCIEINSSTLSTTYARIVTTYTKSISDLIGGETLQLGVSNMSLRLYVALSTSTSKSSNVNGLKKINAGTFRTFLKIFYKFNTESSYTFLQKLELKGSISNQGLTTVTIGTGQVVYLYSDAEDDLNIIVPKDATSCEFRIEYTHANDYSTSITTNNDSIYIYASGVELYRNTSGNAYYAYTYSYNLYTGSISGYALNYYNSLYIGVVDKTYKTNIAEYLQDTIRTGGVNILRTLGTKHDTFNINDSSYDLKSSLVISTPESINDGTPGFKNAFTKIDNDKFEACSDNGYVQLTSLGLHQRANKSNLKIGGDLLITVPTTGSIIFGQTNENGLTENEKNLLNAVGYNNNNSYPLYSSNVTLRPYANNTGYLGSSSCKWYYIYSNYGEFSETVKAKVFVQTSDEKLKNIKEEIQVDLERLKEIPKIYFNYKDDNIDDNKRIGTIAQDVQKFYPEIVHESEDGYLTLEYDKLSVIALKGIDELYENQKRLESEIKELKSLILKYIEQ